jgi:hypothetical protein
MPDGSNLTNVVDDDLKSRLQEINDRCPWLLIGQQIIYDTLDALEGRGLERLVERLRFVVQHTDAYLAQIDALSDTTKPAPRS